MSWPACSIQRSSRICARSAADRFSDETSYTRWIALEATNENWREVRRI